MTLKSCPTCGRSYADQSLSFCLEDGSLLSAPFVDADASGPDSTTVVRSSGGVSPGPGDDRKSKFRERKDAIFAKFKFEGNTKEVHPILDSEPIYKRP